MFFVARFRRAEAIEHLRRALAFTAAAAQRAPQVAGELSHAAGFMQQVAKGVGCGPLWPAETPPRARTLDWALSEIVDELDAAMSDLDEPWGDGFLTAVQEDLHTAGCWIMLAGYEAGVPVDPGASFPPVQDLVSV